MTNVSYKVEGDKLVIEVDLTQEHGKSASGKTIIIASTRGNASIPYKGGNVTMGLNVYKK